MKIVRWLTATLLFAGLFVGISQQAAHAVILNAETVAAGDWGDQTKWDCDTGTGGQQQCVPGSGHNVTIKHAMTMGASANATEAANKLTINASQSLTFNPAKNVQLSIRGNFIVKGTLTMGSSTFAASKLHKVRFTGMDESTYHDGGDYGSCGFCAGNPPAQDVGLWVLDDGVLDLQGTDKVPWCRCDGDASWQSGDELRAAPIGYGEAVQDASDFPTFNPSTQNPATVTFGDGEAYETTYTQEILNLTRNVQIYGTDDDERAHIYIFSTQPQTLKQVEIRYMGPRHNSNADFWLGRYALHFHKMDMIGSGAASTVVENVVVAHAGSHAFVPHMSGGITFDGTISYNTFEDAYWWDGPPDQSYPDPPNPTTDDTIITNAVAALVRSDPDYEGVRLAGFNLGAGLNNSITNSVAVGVQGTVDSAGFVWPETTSTWGYFNNGVDCDPTNAGTQGCDEFFGAWVFDGNLAHNNSGSGATVWQVNSNDHVITDFEAFHNGMNGVFNGAYGNPYKWDGLKLFSNGAANSEDILGPHTQFFAFMASLDVDGAGANDETPWQLTNSILDAGGLTDSAVVLASRGIIDSVGANAQPGEFLGNTFAGYNAEAVFFSFAYHDLDGLPHTGYENKWFFDDANVFDLHGSLPDFYFDPSNQPGTSPPVLTIHEDSSIEVEGLGTLWRYDHSSGTLDTACNCKVV